MIPIQNIYHMLAYAFQILNEQGYKDLATEPFENTAELLAAILEKGVTLQLKRGLNREYLPKTEALSSLRGRIDIPESIKQQTMRRKQMVCTYDDFSVNSMLNRIIKSTVLLLLRSDISSQRKKQLRKLMVCSARLTQSTCIRSTGMGNITETIRTYRMMISVCYLVVKGLYRPTRMEVHA